MATFGNLKDGSSNPSKRRRSFDRYPSFQPVVKGNQPLPSSASTQQEREGRRVKPSKRTKAYVSDLGGPLPELKYTEWLDLHPQLRGKELSEVHFFDLLRRIAKVGLRNGRKSIVIRLEQRANDVVVAWLDKWGERQGKHHDFSTSDELNGFSIYRAVNNPEVKRAYFNALRQPILPEISSFIKEVAHTMTAEQHSSTSGY